MAGMYCWQCGAANENAAVCGRCGAPGESRAPGAATTTAPVTTGTASSPGAWPVISPEPVGDAILLARLEDEASTAARQVGPPPPSKARRVGLAVVITAIAMAVAGVMSLTLGLIVWKVTVGGPGASPPDPAVSFPVAYPPDPVVYHPVFRDATLSTTASNFLGMRMPYTWVEQAGPSSLEFARMGDPYVSLDVRVMPGGNASLESFAQAALLQYQGRLEGTVLGARVAKSVMGLPALELSGYGPDGAHYRFIVVADAARQMMYTLFSQDCSGDPAVSDEIQAGIDSLYTG